MRRKNRQHSLLNGGDRRTKGGKTWRVDAPLTDQAPAGFWYAIVVPQLGVILLTRSERIARKTYTKTTGRVRILRNREKSKIKDATFSTYGSVIAAK